VLLERPLWGEVAAREQPPGRRDPDHEDGQQHRERAQGDGAADQGVRWGVVVEGAEEAQKGNGRPGLGDEADGKASTWLERKTVRPASSTRRSSPWIPTLAPYRLVNAASSITAVIVDQS
jgi:hypothetical protein